MPVQTMASVGLHVLPLSPLLSSRSAPTETVPRLCQTHHYQDYDAWQLCHYEILCDIRQLKTLRVSRNSD